MPRNGSGVYTLPPGSEAVSGQTISSADYNDALSDLADALTDSLSKSGDGAASDDLSLGGHKITNLAAGSSANDAVCLAQITDAFQPLDAELTALAALATTGLVARTSDDTYVPRAITATAPAAVSNGDGVAGGPAISVADLAGDSGSGGSKGIPPAPAAGDAAARKYLSAAATWSNPPGAAPDVILQDQKTFGTDAGSSTGSGQIQVRDLNTKVYDPNGYCTLSSNRFTLPAGTWYIVWSAPGYRCDAHQTYLHNFTDNNGDVRGTTEWSDNDSATTSRSEGSAVVTIAGSKAFDIRHQTGNSMSSTGLGRAAEIAAEVYTRVQIWRVA